MGYITCNQTPQLVGICKGRKGAVYEADDLAEMDVGGSAPQTIAALLTFPPLSKARHSNWENRVGGSGETWQNANAAGFVLPDRRRLCSAITGKREAYK